MSFNSKFTIAKLTFGGLGTAIALLAIAFLPAAQAEEPAVEPPPPALAFVGTWACQAVHGGPFTGRACPAWPQLTLIPDGTYLWGSEKGQWKAEAGLLHLSGRKGTGRLIEDGHLVVEYESQGVAYRQLLFKR